MFITWRPSGPEGFREPFRFEERSITKAQLAQVGVEHDSLVWNQANNWMIPEEDISDKVWPYIVADSNLIRVDRDGQAVASTGMRWSEPEPEPAAEPAAELTRDVPDSKWVEKEK